MKHGGPMKKVNKFKYKRVRIYWQDIVSNPEWMSLDKAKDQVYSWCEDTGYLLYKDQKRLIIFASHDKSLRRLVNSKIYFEAPPSGCSKNTL